MNNRECRFDTWFNHIGKFSQIYKSESTSSRYFGYVKYNSAAPGVFAEVTKVSNQTRLWDTSHLICVYELEHSLGMRDLKST